MRKKVILYGSSDCPGCVACKEAFDDAGVKYGYVDILGGLAHLNKFLAVREDHRELFKDVIENRKVGIPTIVVNDTDVYVYFEGLDIKLFLEDEAE